MIWRYYLKRVVIVIGRLFVTQGKMQGLNLSLM